MDDWLSFKTDHSSWFKENGAGCGFIQNSTGNATQDISRTVEGCVLEFEV